MYSALINDEVNEHERHEKVKESLRWLRDNNWLYKRFFSNYETLYRLFQSDKISFGLNHTDTHDSAPILADERASLLIHRENVWDVPPPNVHDHILALQHPETNLATGERDFQAAMSRCPQYQSSHSTAVPQHHLAVASNGFPLSCKKSWKRRGVGIALLWRVGLMTNITVLIAWKVTEAPFAMSLVFEGEC